MGVESGSLEVGVGGWEEFEGRGDFGGWTWGLGVGFGVRELGIDLEGLLFGLEEAESFGGRRLAEFEELESELDDVWFFFMGAVG